MDLQEYARHVLADQFVVQPVDETLVCVMGPFVLLDGQHLELYLREPQEGTGWLEIAYYCGLAEVLSLEALHELRETCAEAREVLSESRLVLASDRVWALSTRDDVLEDLCTVARALQELDRLLRH